MACQSETMVPSKPHSPRSTSRSIQRLACEGMPSISLYEGIRLRACPCFTATSNGGKKTSRSVRSPRDAGPTFVPDSGWPCPVMCLSVAITCSAGIVRPPPWRPRTAARPIRDARYGSSP